MSVPSHQPADASRSDSAAPEAAALSDAGGISPDSAESSAATADGSRSTPAEADAHAADVLALQHAGRQVRTVVVGQDAMVDRLMIAVLARGHCLLEGVPGVAKTLAVRTFAVVLGGSFARLQFTPDLVPSDIVGTRIYKPSTETFDPELGPVFVNFVLADEINRAPAKVQAAMLELMGEHQVSLGGVSYQLPNPFVVIATQNPLESEGVYPLPEAQRDRFLLKVDVPLPRAHEEAEILRRMSVRPPTPHPVLNAGQVVRLQDAADEIYVHPLLADYAVRLVMATRDPAEYGLPGLQPIISAGASPRATLGLVAAARAMALIQGRDHVLPHDLQALAVDVIAHRLLLGFDAMADGVDAREVVAEVVRAVPPPRPS